MTVHRKPTQYLLPSSIAGSHLLVHAPIHGHGRDVVVVQDAGEVVRVTDISAERYAPVPRKTSNIRV